MGEDKGEGEIEFVPLTPALSHKRRGRRFVNLIYEIQQYA
jgi:hypothetical protein